MFRACAAVARLWLIAALLVVILAVPAGAELFDKGNRAFRAGDYAQAQAFYTKDLAEGGDTPGDQAVLHYNRACALRNLGRYQEALVDLDRAIALDQTQAPAWGNRALVRAALGQWDQALADARRGVELDPSGTTRNRAILELIQQAKPR